MRVSIERLRSWILVLGTLLLVGLLLFFAYARWEVRRIARDLPGKLGISIQQSTNGFTFSKSDGGHTLFTLHAAKMVQYKNGGHAELHDVSITLYGSDGAPTDHIYGNDFSYDPDGIVRANGEVQIDLQGPANSHSRTATVPADASDGKNIVHVKTSDLVFNQRTAQASTPQRIEFRVAEAAGNATGASFDSRAGVLVLESDVAFNSSVNGSPMIVHAHHAEYDRSAQVLRLFENAMDYMYSHGSSDRALVYFRPDGSAQRIDAQGNVSVNNSEQKITSQSARADLDQRSEPAQAFLNGDVVYVADQGLHHLRGTAASGTFSFGPQASIRHAQLRSAVSVVDEEKSPPDKPQSTQSVRRDVNAALVDVDFAQGFDHRPIAQHIAAAGDAKLDIRTFFAHTPPQETSVEGDRLFATLRDGVALSTLEGAGHTKLMQANGNGVKQTSSGDNLLITFAPASGKVGTVRRKTGDPSPEPSMQIASSVQQGNVLLVQQGKSVGKASPDFTATAEKASYDGATQILQLSGDPRVKDASGELTAAVIELERLTGNTTATGKVKATYRQPGGQPQSAGFNLGSSEPIHVVADRAHLDHAKDLNIFYGNKSEDARLWQGADSIAAPLLELSRPRRILYAHGPRSTQEDAVNAVFVSEGKDFGENPTRQRGQSERTSVVHIASHTLLYSDTEGKAVFHGAVLAQDPSGSLRCDVMEIYFGDAGNAGAGGAKLSPGSDKGTQETGKRQVERMISRGNVQLQQPGRKATGEQLTYTVQDGRFVLNGSESMDPRLVDEVHGTVTGASLIFNDRDDSVIVSSGQSKAVTETHTAK